MSKERYFLVFKRLIAFSVDYLIILIWAGVLFTLSTLLSLTLEIWDELFNNRYFAHFISFTFITAPVILYFTIFDATKYGGTIGKRLLGLNICNVNNNGNLKLTLKKSFHRNLIKFGPWELAHLFIHYGSFINDSQLTYFITISGLILSSALSGIFLIELFFRKDNRPIYDRVSGSVVRM